MSEERELNAMTDDLSPAIGLDASPVERTNGEAGNPEHSAAESTTNNGKTKKAKGKETVKSASGKGEDTVTLRPEDDPRLTWTLQEIPLDELFSPKDDRGSNEVDPDLVASIQKVGLLEPLLVRRDEEEGKYAVIAGKRRFKALPAAGFAGPVPCHVIEEQIIPGQDSLIALTENALREKMSPFDQAKLWAAVLKLTGWSQEEFAEHYGLSKGRVSDYLKLLKAKLPKKVKDQLSRGELSAKAVTRSIDKDGNYNPELAKAKKKVSGDKAGLGVVYKTWPDEETGITLVAQGLKKKPPSDQELIVAIKNWLASLEDTAQGESHQSNTSGEERLSRHQSEGGETCA